MWVREWVPNSDNKLPRKGNIMSNVAAQLNNLNDLEAQIAALKAQAAEIKKEVKNTPRLKVSQKGAISVYGLQRMPVTLYAGQWERIIELVNSGVFADFIAQNESTLTRKGETPKQEAAPVVAKKPAKSKKTPKLTKCGAVALGPDGPTDADLAKIEALNAKVSRMPASDLFED